MECNGDLNSIILNALAALSRITKLSAGDKNNTVRLDFNLHLLIKESNTMQHGTNFILSSGDDSKTSAKEKRENKSLGIKFYFVYA